MQSIWNFWWLRSEIYRRTYDVYGEAYFRKKLFTNWLKNGFATLSLNRNDGPLSGNTLTLWSRKRLIKLIVQTIFWDIIGSLTIDSLEKGCWAGWGWQCWLRSNWSVSSTYGVTSTWHWTLIYNYLYNCRTAVGCHLRIFYMCAVWLCLHSTCVCVRANMHVH